ncbi:hypothetical protein [Agrobacterium tumefaciens]|uniref:hypothetical protein n=1 Tax=Agrobacterium tumefaciens TaxID=358 RepID=UPI00287F36F8|nr:hypothetical protein [Agrobacterium tumefaciens]MDS7595117.1 hypothetical protein [Agrobacterium tumefaciens]
MGEPDGHGYSLHEFTSLLVNHLLAQECSIANSGGMSRKGGRCNFRFRVISSRSFSFKRWDIRAML